MVAESACKILHDFKPVMLMVVVQIAYTGMNVLYKLVVNDGMNLRVLVAYRWLFSTIFIAPLALMLERLENLGLRTRIGSAKVLGTLIGIGGAMLLTLYKGASVNIWSTNFSLLKSSSRHPKSNHMIGGHILGSLLALVSCTSCAVWLIIQAKMSKNYPCHYSSAAMMSMMASIQCVIFSLCTERDWSEWKLGWNIRLLTAAYTGIVTSGLVVILIAWCVHLRGPVFVSSFTPLSLVLITIVGSFVLEEKLYLGSLLGAGLIVCGLYMVLWGKSKEVKEQVQSKPTKGSDKSDFVNIITDGQSTISATSGRDLNEMEILNEGK